MPSETVQPGSMVVYVPVHYDFSHIEFVAPFLEEFPESKVFVYKWHGMREKIRKHYLESPEYATARVCVYDFTLKNIIKCILDEPKGRQVVFLLTAGMAYEFGGFQRDLLKDVKVVFEEKIPDIKLLWGLSVIGHCLYGCNSCKDLEHKIPIYFTRYFKKSIPYDASFIKNQYFPSNHHDLKMVLCAPSYGETSVLQERNILEHLKYLQDKGKYNFVWKFHPAVYNAMNYESKTKEDCIEYDNVQWIMKNFSVTKEEQPCLLPFLEAFDMIFCDLHSSVPFISSYFSPKAIVTFWNDADYEVPAPREPDFLENFYVFQSLDELKGMMNIDLDGVPKPKGSPKFFHNTYGYVDGNEVNKFAKISCWPNSPAAPKNNILNSNSPVLRQLVFETAKKWQMRYENVKNDATLAADMKLAMGLVKECDLERKLIAPKILPQPSGNRVTKLRVMSFNLWHGCTGSFAASIFAGGNLKGEGSFKKETQCSAVSVPGGPVVLKEPLSNEQARSLIETASKVIAQAGADILCCQEACYAPADPDPSKSIVYPDIGNPWVNCIPHLSECLEKNTGKAWKYVDLSEKRQTGMGPWGILTCLNIGAKSCDGWGVEIGDKSLGVSIWIFNAHLPYKPYQPYQLCRPFIPYEEFGLLKNAEEAEKEASNTRLSTVKLISNDMEKSNSVKKLPVIFCGDFNEPSAEDWVPQASIAGYHPMPVLWPSTSLLLNAGLRDTYRTLHPDATLEPGFTWSPAKYEFESGSGDSEGWRNHGDGLRDKSERIDYVFYKNADGEVGIHPRKVEIVGSAQSPPNGRESKVSGDVDLGIECGAWTSDHRAVCVEFDVYKK